MIKGSASKPSGSVSKQSSPRPIPVAKPSSRPCLRAWRSGHGSCSVLSIARAMASGTGRAIDRRQADMAEPSKDLERKDASGGHKLGTRVAALEVADLHFHHRV